ncbi:hypothetical protein CLI78_04125 [Porphyromonas gingivalis]|uniref:DUF3427 domain-containing protein n=1 Tax=Porphyromonas gingivalis TaxID=837 RepID=UPI000BE74354|nr:DUF3427 domain-containing protein [Porphyromonas gingivalis]PDP66542.1 hypothetical protein CLI78_04125 [Porphyromonas gingivalis]
MFTINKEYTKKDIYRIFQVPESRQKGAWDTGYRLYERAFFIFANIGASRRTGHNYSNSWLDKEKQRLEWFGQTNSKLRQPKIQKLVSGEYPVHIFTRNENTNPFIYAGEGLVVRTEDTSPLKIIWAINVDKYLQQYSESNPDGEEYSFREGSVKIINTNRCERNPQARKECIKHFGCKCMVCGFDFEKVYEKIGKNYIHVHHIRPIATTDGEYEVNPILGLVPICPNCHAMIHAHIPPLSISELKVLMNHE